MTNKSPHPRSRPMKYKKIQSLNNIGKKTGTKRK